MASIFGYINEETPKYTIVKKSSLGYEIRAYEQQIRASVTMPSAGGESVTTQKGFGQLAQYIFGGNKARADENKRGGLIAMTAPVMMEGNSGADSKDRGENGKSSRIAMTAPVMMESNEAPPADATTTLSPAQEPTTTISFILPSKYQSIDDLPIPKNDNVKLDVVSPQTLAVLTFSGRWTQAYGDAQLDKLLSMLSKDADVEVLGGKGTEKVARYNPPWTLPWLRTNEVMIGVRVIGGAEEGASS